MRRGRRSRPAARTAASVAYRRAGRSARLGGTVAGSRLPRRAGLDGRQRNRGAPDL